MKPMSLFFKEQEKQDGQDRGAAKAASGAGSGKDRTGKLADRPACARSEHDPAGVRRLCARRCVAGGPDPDPGL